MQLSPFGPTRKFDSSAKNLEQELKSRGIKNIKLYHRYKLPNNATPASYMIKQALRTMYLVQPDDDILQYFGCTKQQIQMIRQEIKEKKDFYTQEVIQEYKQLLELNPELPYTDNLMNQCSVLDGAMFGFGPDEIKYFITDYNGINGEYKKLQDQIENYGIKLNYILAPQTINKIIAELEKTTKNSMINKNIQQTPER